MPVGRIGRLIFAQVFQCNISRLSAASPSGSSALSRYTCSGPNDYAYARQAYNRACDVSSKQLTVLGMLIQLWFRKSHPLLHCLRGRMACACVRACARTFVRSLQRLYARHGDVFE